MAKESPKQQRIVGRVMREFKEGQLESGGDGGRSDHASRRSPSH